MEERRKSRLRSFADMLGTAAMAVVIAMMVFLIAVIIWAYTLSVETRTVLWYQEDLFNKTAGTEYMIYFDEDQVCVDEASRVYRIDVSYVTDAGIQSRTFRNRALRGNDVLCGGSAPGAMAYSVTVYTAIKKDESY
jgi:hypothetical protein